MKTDISYVIKVRINVFKLREGLIWRNLLDEFNAKINCGDKISIIGLSRIQSTNPDIKMLPCLEQLIQMIVNKNGEGLDEETKDNARCVYY